MNKRSISFLIAVGCTLLTTACQPIQPLSESSAKVTTTTVTTAPATTAASLQERYAAALQDAKIAEADEVFDGIVIIVERELQVEPVTVKFIGLLRGKVIGSRHF